MGSDERAERLKELSEAIVDALGQNENVMRLIAGLKRARLIDSETMLGLALRVDDLERMTGGLIVSRSERVGHIAERASDRPRANESELAERYIDGSIIDSKSAAFERFASDRFDERAWLARLGLKWRSDESA